MGRDTLDWDGMAMEALAGDVVSQRQVPFALPDTGLEEADAAREVLLDGWLTTGDRCHQFEEVFAERVGASHAVAVNSCTAALHLALEGIGVRPGDIVVTTPYTHAATAEAIRYLGALPVFVDVDPTTCNMECGAFEDLVDRLEAGDRSALPPHARDTYEPAVPRAVVPVHIGGVPCDMERIFKSAATYGMAVVEDAAHAFPSTIATRPVGSFPWCKTTAAACFSFYATKSITTGEGGMLVTHDGNLAARARRMSLHGLSRDAWSRHGHEASWKYDIVAPGYKYNLTDIAAAVGLVQLGRTDVMHARRAAIARRYRDVLGSHPALDVPTIPTGVMTSWHLYMLRLRLDHLRIGRDEFIDELSARGVGTSVHFIPLHLHSYYRRTLGYQPSDFPVAYEEYGREVSLPIYSAMSDEDVDHVAHAVRDVADRFAR